MNDLNLRASSLNGHLGHAVCSGAGRTATEHAGDTPMTRVSPPAPTVGFVDECCAQYRAPFANVRHFKQFTQLHLGLLAETRRKCLPRIAKEAQADHQALQPLLANANWS